MNEMQEYTRPGPKGQILLVPGDVVYEFLLKHDPKKLKRQMKQEKAYYLETHAPGYDEQYRKDLVEAKAHDEQRKKRSADYRLLGLDQVQERITKRVVRNAYRRQARKLHPDTGGSHEAMIGLQNAYHRVLASVPKE